MPIKSRLWSTVQTLLYSPSCGKSSTSSPRPAYYRRGPGGSRPACLRTAGSSSASDRGAERSLCWSPGRTTSQDHWNSEIKDDRNVSIIWPDPAGEVLDGLRAPHDDECRPLQGHAWQLGQRSVPEIMTSWLSWNVLDLNDFKDNVFNLIQNRLTSATYWLLPCTRADWALCRPPAQWTARHLWVDDNNGNNINEWWFLPPSPGMAPRPGSVNASVFRLYVDLNRKKIIKSQIVHNETS